ncbi:hypothetical protein GOBAR_DD32730 [Gossypium barbadense]|nr:hypothetical protein GOBAR_DD32730 [Gossypium barbadense]
MSSPPNFMLSRIERTSNVRISSSVVQNKGTDSIDGFFYSSIVRLKRARLYIRGSDEWTEVDGDGEAGDLSPQTVSREMASLMSPNSFPVSGGKIGAKGTKSRNQRIARGCATTSAGALPRPVTRHPSALPPPEGSEPWDRLFSLKGK